MKDSFTKSKVVYVRAWARITSRPDFVHREIVTATVISCGWPGTTSHSVRFNELPD